MFTFDFYDEGVEDKTVHSEIEDRQVRALSLEQVLGQLPDTLAYSILAGLPRRELWHVKMQLMQNDQDTELLGQSDVIKGLYEGGLKTWECSVDLAQYLSQQTYPNDLSVLEVLRPYVRHLKQLGCGSALPTSQLLLKALKDKKSCNFTLQDYNDIFGLVTLPNLFLTWYILEHGTSTTEFDVTPELKTQFMKTLNDVGIELQFIVGAWGPSLIVRPI